MKNLALIFLVILFQINTSTVAAAESQSQTGELVFERAIVSNAISRAL